METLSQQHQFMQRAIELSRLAGIEEHTGGAFGAVIVQADQIVGEGYNQVVEYNDPTCHAELQAIRDASNMLQTSNLTDCILFTSAYPCPMCLAGCYWAKISTIYYAVTMEDVAKYGHFPDQQLYQDICKPCNEQPATFIELLRSEALKVWQDYAKLYTIRTY